MNSIIIRTSKLKVWSYDVISDENYLQGTALVPRIGIYFLVGDYFKITASKIWLLHFVHFHENWRKNLSKTNDFQKEHERVV